MVLANASLDIAFHDDNKGKLSSNNYDNNINNKEINKEYIQQFFVGLLEGDGTITTGMVSKIKKPQSVRIRMIIALKRNNENINMLNLIKENVCGRVVLQKKKNYEYVVWIAEKKKDILNVFALLSKYPLLTARKQCQLKFALDCSINKYIYEEFVKLRNNKYDLILDELDRLSNSKIPNYFPSWLSGFIEGEGNFSLVFNEKGKLRKSAFSIGQNDELHILNKIKEYFKGETKILKDKQKKNVNVCHYRLHLYNEKTRRCIFNHFSKYPLLGYKYISYKKFYDYHNKYV